MPPLIRWKTAHIATEKITAIAYTVIPLFSNLPLIDRNTKLITSNLKNSSAGATIKTLKSASDASVFNDPSVNPISGTGNGFDDKICAVLGVARKSKTALLNNPCDKNNKRTDLVLYRINANTKPAPAIANILPVTSSSPDRPAIIEKINAPAIPSGT